MSQKLFVLCALVACLVASVLSMEIADPSIHDEAFLKFVNKYARSWVAGKNEVFEGKNLSHAKKLVGLNLPTQEKREAFPKKPFQTATDRFLAKATANVPDNYSAVNNTAYSACKGLHTIRNQEQCGSCWAFATSEMVGDRFCIASKGAVNFLMSPQYMVSCDKKDHGCQGGEFDLAFEFAQETGLVSDACVPYKSGDGDVPKCPTKCANDEDINKHYKMSKARNFDVSDIKGMQESIMNNGPLVSGFKVYRDFFNYKSGVYRHTAGGLQGGHAIKVVGWGVTSTNVPYWIVANSWSEKWGIDGYFWIVRGTNECTIEENMWEATPVLN